MNELTHETTSELLAAYVAGGLSAPDQLAVELHLESCSDCSLELAGVRLLSADEVEPMTGTERDRLSHAVRAAVTAPAKRSWSERFGRRVAPALGAVALIAIAVVAIVSLPRDSQDAPALAPNTAESGALFDADTGTGGAGAADAATEELGSDAGQPATSQGHAAGAATKGSNTAPDTAAQTEIALRPSSTTLFYDTSFAAIGFDLGALVPAQSPKRMAGGTFASLTESAPDERVASWIETCAGITISTSREELTATSAAYYATDDVLVIGFTWIDTSTARLNYFLQGWRAGRCDRVTPIYRAGHL
ncbi:MAG: hypothetical protein QOG04_1329 [Actinomycetota bacterium]|jgi:anti-sigma factor RsiW|nr:hypothetical protein [Actinomycetota bacterium]